MDITKQREREEGGNECAKIMMTSAPFNVFTRNDMVSELTDSIRNNDLPDLHCIVSEMASGDSDHGNRHAVYVQLKKSNIALLMVGEPGPRTGSPNQLTVLKGNYRNILKILGGTSDAALAALQVQMAGDPRELKVMMHDDICCAQKAVLSSFIADVNHSSEHNHDASPGM